MAAATASNKASRLLALLRNGTENNTEAVVDPWCILRECLSDFGHLRDLTSKKRGNSEGSSSGRPVKT